MTSAAEAGFRRQPHPEDAPQPTPGPPKRLRDGLTADHLLAAVRAMHPRAEPGAFVAEWWDGASLVAALLVSVEGRRVRAVAGPAGELLLLPRGSRAARRRLRRIRRDAGDGSLAAPAERPHVAVTPGGLPRTPLVYEVSVKRPRQAWPGPPGPRLPLRIGGAVDYRACSHVGCGAVVPLPAQGADPPCPRCGRR